VAGERKGEVFECLIVMALQDIGYELGRNLFWGEKPTGFSIDPDFILGSLDAPSHWLLATSSGSAKNSLEKFWRNVGELFEAKRVFSNPPLVVNLVLETNLRDALQTAMSALTDSELLLQRTDYGQTLENFIEKLGKRVPNGREDKVKFLRTKIDANVEVTRAYNIFKSTLRTSLTISKPEFNALWRMLRKEARSPCYRAARATYVRRGIAKLMVFPETTRKSLYDHILTSQRLGKLPNYLYKLDYATRTIAGSIVSDSEIQWVVKHLPAETIEYIIAQSYRARPDNWNNWISVLRDAKILLHQKYIETNYDELIKPKGMLKHLLSHAPNGYKWLFAHLMEVFKIASGKRQGYGYSVLSRDVGYATGISQGYLELSDWVNGFIESLRATGLIADVATALSARLKQIPLATLTKIGPKVEAEYFRNLMETKVISYWLFEPLPLLIRRALLKGGKEVREVKKHPTFIGEYLNKPTQIASPHVIRSGSTLVSWRSAYDLGRHHKTKELSGRSQALRFSFCNGKFSRRNGIKRMILLLDGTFTDDQLRVLLDAGWDEVFYPDELEEFVNSIV
jgi:hypothetical protein